MMTSPPSSSYSVPPTSSKRQSLNISTGPRPLHLLDGNILAGPATAPLDQSASYFHSPTSASSTPPSNGKNANRTHRYQPRRQSSISYNPPDRSDSSIRSPLSKTHSLSRSVSLGPKALHSPSLKGGDRKSTGSVSKELERPPLTLAEKHAELLHFIAQKESKCLELRSQLAVHETELLQLKKKWERIVNRGFDRITKSEYSAESIGLNGQGSGAVLEGIKEGVQGVSRFLAAGLNMGELSTPVSPSPMGLPPRTMHSASESNSSASTFMTKSTRFSASSASSLGETAPAATTSRVMLSEEDKVQILMVHDTGATPTMSPNPEFMRQQSQRRQASPAPSPSPSPAPSVATSDLPASQPATSRSTKLHRRKSRDVTPITPSAYKDVGPSSKDSPLEESPAEKVKRAKRASLNGAAFPPVSSIPGLGALTVGGGPVVSSWLGSAGKKWEELQRGSSFSKNQKRASVLLSDVSQSIVSALSSPTASAVSTPPSSFSTPLLSSSSSAATLNTASLLDDDDDSGFMALSVMTPDSMSKPVFQPMQPTSPPVSTTRRVGSATKKPQDDEEEWNW